MSLDRGVGVAVEVRFAKDVSLICWRIWAVPVCRITSPDLMVTHPCNPPNLTTTERRRAA